MTVKASEAIHRADDRQRIQRNLLAWYADQARNLPWRSSRDPYAIWVSEVMLQQTRVATVIPYYERFLSALPTVQALAEVDEETLHRLWKGLGYYRRAAFLKKGAKEVVAKFGGQVPQDLAALRSIPGLGAYTAGAVASIAFGLPVSAVDGNVIRVFARLLNDDTPVDKLRERLQKGEADGWVAQNDPGAWTQALMELGATICTPKKPVCTRCPVQKFCRAHAAATVAELPVKGKAVKHVEETIQVGIFRKGAAVWIEKRAGSGLLAGLWGFPILEKLPRARGREVLRYKHVFTHRTWHAAVYEFQAQPPKSSKGKWTETGRLIDEAIPTAFQPVVRLLTSRDLFTA